MTPDEIRLARMQAVAFEKNRPMTELRQVTVVTKQGEPHLVFVSAQRALEYVDMANRTDPAEPYRLSLFAVADAPKVSDL